MTEQERMCQRLPSMSETLLDPQLVRFTQVSVQIPFRGVSLVPRMARHTATVLPTSSCFHRMVKRIQRMCHLSLNTPNILHVQDSTVSILQFHIRMQVSIIHVFQHLERCLGNSRRPMDVCGLNKWNELPVLTFRLQSFLSCVNVEREIAVV